MDYIGGFVVHKKGTEGELILESSLQAFFFDQLSDFNQKSTSPLPSEEIFYSSLVMDKFGDSSNLYENDEGKVRDKILGTKLLESSQMNKLEQQRVLRDIGDTALFICGYFSESLNRKIVDTKYYQDIGMIAYQRLNSHVPQAYEIPSFFKRLSISFSSITTVMSLVFQQNNFEGPEEMFLLFANNKSLKAS